jgi:hypothetical protein
MLHRSKTTLQHHYPTLRRRALLQHAGEEQADSDAHAVHVLSPTTVRVVEESER